MNKYTIGQKLKVSKNVDIEIIRTDMFGLAPHYGVVYFIREVGKETKADQGWIPASVIDAMEVVEL